MACAMVMSLTACGGSKKDDAATADDRGNSSGKTEITWWAFPTFTQENADDAVGTTYEQKKRRKRNILPLKDNMAIYWGGTGCPLPRFFSLRHGRVLPGARMWTGSGKCTVI